jgi:hypothetical protein
VLALAIAEPHRITAAVIARIMRCMARLPLLWSYSRAPAIGLAHRRARASRTCEAERCPGAVLVAAGTEEHDPEKHALGLDPRVETAFRKDHALQKVRTPIDSIRSD